MHCHRHTMTVANEQCGQCKTHFCGDCLVRPFGPKKPPLCVGCALVVAGVKHGRVARNVDAPEPAAVANRTPVSTGRRGWRRRSEPALDGPLPEALPQDPLSAEAVGIVLPSWAK